VPGASWFVPDRLVWTGFVRFPWAKSATAMPRRQSTEAVKIRRLKNADFEVDFFFMNEVELFPSPVKQRWAKTLPDTEELCQMIIFSFA
jgi:hypothetical protein